MQTQESQARQLSHLMDVSIGNLRNTYEHSSNVYENLRLQYYVHSDESCYTAVFVDITVHHITASAVEATSFDVHSDENNKHVIRCCVRTKLTPGAHQHQLFTHRNPNSRNF